MEDVSASLSQTTHSALGTALLISLLGILITSFAIILCHLLLIKFCRQRHDTATPVAESAAEATPNFTGVEEKVLQTIPIFAFSAVKCDMDQDECVVCLGELEDNDAVRLLPNCHHAFHVACIDMWFVAQTNCPLCRSPVVSEEGTNWESEPSVVNAHLANESDREITESSTSNSYLEYSARERTFGLLRHCAPVAVPPTSPSRLKRSLSMDQSWMRTNLQGSSSSSRSGYRALRRSGSYTTRPVSSHFDCGGPLSATWLRSISLLRLGKGISSGPILPY